MRRTAPLKPKGAAPNLQTGPGLAAEILAFVLFLAPSGN
jgi:hypothetical protein